MELGQGYHGIRGATPESLLLDAGVVYKNINVAALRAGGSGQFGNAISAATLVGATRGGGSWNSGRELREIEINGRIFPLKDGKRPSGYAPILQVSLLEVTKQNVIDALGASNVDEWTAFSEITPAVAIDSSDYIDNIAWVGKVVGYSDPMIIVLENVLSSEPLSVPVEDKNEAVLAVTMMAHATMASPQTPPFHIFYPKTQVGGGGGGGGGGITVTSSNPAEGEPAFGGSFIVLTFSGALNEAAAENPANYVLIRDPGGANFNVPLNNPAYADGGGGGPFTVTITPTNGFFASNDYELTFADNGAPLGTSPYTLTFTTASADS